MLFLTTTPHAYRRLQEEIDQGIAEGRISSPITNAEAKALPYLQAVIHETRRYYPINIGTFPKVVPPKGDTLAGQFVPGGTKIAINQRSLLRNKVSPPRPGLGMRLTPFTGYFRCRPGHIPPRALAERVAGSA